MAQEQAVVENRAGIFDNPQHTEGGFPTRLIDTGRPIEVEGGEFNFPEWVKSDKTIYTLSGKNYDVIRQIFQIIGASWDDKVTHIKSGDMIICIRSAFDDTERTYIGTLHEILSSINTSCGCKHMEGGATMVNHETNEVGQTKKSNVAGVYYDITKAGSNKYLKIMHVQSRKPILNLTSSPVQGVKNIIKKSDEILSKINWNVPESEITPEHNKIALELKDKIKIDPSLHRYVVKMHIGGTAPESPTINSEGGYDYNGIEEDRAKRVALITIPKDIAGTNCSNCIFFKDGFCDHEEVLLPVNNRMCCTYWDRESLGSAISNLSKADFFPDKKYKNKTYPLNDRGGYDYTSDPEALERAKNADLITFPPKIVGTTCAIGNCKWTDKQMFCIHPKVQLPVTDRMTCGVWDNEEVIRPWGAPVEHKFKKGGEPAGNKPLEITDISGKHKVIDFNTDDKFSHLFFGNPTTKEIAEFNKWLKKNRDTYVRLYHGTSSKIPVLQEGLKPTSRKTAKSLQSGSGFVYLSVYPSMSKQYADLAYSSDVYHGVHSEVYAVDIPVKELKPDKDNLSNKRMYGLPELGGSLGESLAVAHSVSVPRAILPYELSIHHLKMINGGGTEEFSEDLIAFLGNKSSVPAIGEEKGKKVDNGISKYTSENGSYRYVKYLDGIPLAVLQIVSRDGIHGQVANVYTVPKSRRKGFSKKLLSRAQEDFTTIGHSNFLSISGKGFKQYAESHKQVGNIAPNGKPSNLTPEQYALVRTPEFISWFGNWQVDPKNSSKVVDENGEPLVLFHYSSKQKERFYTFRTDKELGSHFGTRAQVDFIKRNKGTENKEKLYEVFLNIRNPIRMMDVGFFKGSGLADAFAEKYPQLLSIAEKIHDIESDIFSAKGTGMSNEKLADKTSKEAALKNGIDGVVYLNRFESNDSSISDKGIDEIKDNAYLELIPNAEDSWIAFLPEQIKLADGTNKTFDDTNPDMRFTDGGQAFGNKIAQGYVNTSYKNLKKILGTPNVESEKEKIGWYMAIDPRHIGAVWTEADKPLKEIKKEKFHKWFIWAANEESDKRLRDVLKLQVRDIDPVKQKQKEKEISEERWKKKRVHIEEMSNNIHKIKTNVARDLNSDDEKEVLTALIVAVMLATSERVGNEESMEEDHCGVTGFQKRHVTVTGNEVLLNYTGKSGVKHEKRFTDKRIAKALKKAIKNSPSKFVFETSDKFRIKCDKVNRYLEPFGVTAKNIRGFNANAGIIKKLKYGGIPEEPKQRKKLFNAAVKKTAGEVGHGASTLKKHYMIPELHDEYVLNGNIIDMKNLGYYHEAGDAGEEPIKEEKKYLYLSDDTKKDIPVWAPATSYFLNPHVIPDAVNKAAEALVDHANDNDLDIRDVYSSYPVREVPYKDVVPMQDDMDAFKIEEYVKTINDDFTKPFMLYYQGKYYLSDGHHRTISSHLNGKPIMAHVYEVKEEIGLKEGGDTMSFEEFSAELEKPKQDVIDDMQLAIDKLKLKYDKINNTKYYSDELAKSFPLGRVGFESRQLTKIRDRDLEKTINNAVTSNEIKRDIGYLESRLKSYQAGKTHVTGMQKTMPLHKLNEMIVLGEKMLKSGEMKGVKMTDEEIGNLKDIIAHWKKQRRDKEKKHKVLYDQYLARATKKMDAGGDLTDDQKKEAEKIAKAFVASLSTQDLQSLTEEVKKVMTQSIIEAEKELDKLASEKAKLEDERNELYKKEKELPWGDEKRAAFERRNEISKELLALNIKIRTQDNVIKALKNGGDLVSFTDKKGFNHTGVPSFVKINSDLISFEEDKILTDAVPPYIPVISEEEFKLKGYVFDAIRIAPDLYLLAVNGYDEDQESGKDKGYVLVTLDQLALINDYYFTKEKALLQKQANESNKRLEATYNALSRERRESFINQKNFYHSTPASVKKKYTQAEFEALSLEEKEALYKPIKRTGVKRLTSKLRDNQMWKSFHHMYERFVDPEAKEVKTSQLQTWVDKGFITAEAAERTKARTSANTVWGHPEVFAYWKAFRDMMEWKIKDIQVQRVEMSEVRKIALETSFGESNTNDQLKEKYGILVKRQDGSKILPAQIEQIRVSWEKINKTYGDLVKNAKDVNLKISHTGVKYVFASKAAGMFLPDMKTIAVSNKFGDNQFESIMAHEVGHFIDYSIGKLSGKRHISDDFESSAGLVARALRDNMNTPSDSDYINSTSECFARAMEQYFATENFGEDASLVYSYTPLDAVRTYHSENNYVSKEAYSNKLKPLIKKFLADNESFFKYTVE